MCKLRMYRLMCKLKNSKNNYLPFILVKTNSPLYNEIECNRKENIRFLLRIRREVLSNKLAKARSVNTTTKKQGGYTLNHICFFQDENHLIKKIGGNSIIFTKDLFLHRIGSQSLGKARRHKDVRHTFICRPTKKINIISAYSQSKG